MANKFKYLQLVKIDYSSCEKDWVKKNKKMIDKTLKDNHIYLGQYPDMPGHSALINMRTGKLSGCHTENLRVCTEEEM